MKLIVFIPAYNEEEKVGEVVKSIPKKLNGIDEINVLVVNDGSKDNTAKIAQDAGAIVESHKMNLGLGNAFRTGIEKALELGADILVNIDADGQFASSDIPRLIEPILKKEADFVTADRFTKDGVTRKPEYMSSIKFWGNMRMNKLISRITGYKFNDVSCGFRAYSKETLLKLNLNGSFTYTQESFLDLCTKKVKIHSIPVDVKYFPERKSRMASSIMRYAKNTGLIIIRTYRDYKPLAFFGKIGNIFFFIGILIGLFVLIHYIREGAFTPYIFLGFTSVYLFSIGFIFWIVGLVADMVDRIRLNQEKILYYEKKRIYPEK